MEIIEERFSESTVVRLRGDVDLQSFPALKEVLNRILSEECRHVVVNLQGVILISSTGIGALVGFKRDLEQAGGALALASLSPICVRVLDLLRLDDIFDIYESEQDALAAFDSV